MDFKVASFLKEFRISSGLRFTRSEFRLQGLGLSDLTT